MPLEGIVAGGTPADLLAGAPGAVSRLGARLRGAAVGAACPAT